MLVCKRLEAGKKGMLGNACMSKESEKAGGT